MKIRAFAAVFCLIAFGYEGYAQHAGFRIAVAPPVARMVQSPVSGFVTSPVTGFGVMPTVMQAPISTFGSFSQFNGSFITGFGGFQSPAVVVRSPRIASNRGVTVIVPGGTVIASGPTVISQAGGFVTPYVVVGPGSVIQGPVIVGGSHFAAQPGGKGSHKNSRDARRHEGRTLAIGTPRAHVIQQFGSPSMSIVTRNRETLHFGGGVTIVLQDGRVVQPR